MSRALGALDSLRRFLLVALALVAMNVALAVGGASARTVAGGGGGCNPQINDCKSDCSSGTEECVFDNGEGMDWACGRVCP